MSILKGKDI